MAQFTVENWTPHQSTRCLHRSLVMMTRPLDPVRSMENNDGTKEQEQYTGLSSTLHHVNPLQPVSLRGLPWNHWPLLSRFWEEG